MEPRALERHFTVTGFVSHQGRTALHWHRFGLWLPPGGHIEENEDPIEAMLREVAEETGIEVDVVPTSPAFGYAHPPQLPPPVTIGIYDIARDGRTDGPHQHIDFIYFTRPRPGVALELPDDEHGWAWVDEATLSENRALAISPEQPASEIPEDVRRLGIAAIAAVRVFEQGAS